MDAGKWYQVGNPFVELDDGTTPTLNSVFANGFSNGDQLYVLTDEGAYLPPRQWATLNGQTGWFNRANGQYDQEPLKAGQAVFISKLVSGTVTVKGKVSAQEVVTFGKPDSASWAQVVNVYPKACSVNDLTWSGMSVGDTLYIYDSSSGTYLPQRQWATIGDKTGWFNRADGSFDSQVIPIGQALFINKAAGVASVQVKAE